MGIDCRSGQHAPLSVVLALNQPHSWPVQCAGRPAACRGSQCRGPCGCRMSVAAGTACCACDLVAVHCRPRLRMQGPLLLPAACQGCQGRTAGDSSSGGRYSSSACICTNQQVSWGLTRNSLLLGNTVLDGDCRAQQGCELCGIKQETGSSLPMA